MSTPQPDPWTDLADDIRRAVRTAEECVAALEAEVKALDADRGDLMRVLAEQTGETMRLSGVCNATIALLREDRPRAALALLEEATSA